MPGTLNTPAPTDPIKANGFYSFVVTIPDDDVFSFTPKGTCGHIFIATLQTNHHGCFWWRGSAQAKSFGGTLLNGLNSVLTGTTGVDGQSTFGASGGVLYIENRHGTSVEYVVTLITENNPYE